MFLMAAAMAIAGAMCGCALLPFGGACTLEYRYGVNVTLTDSQTGDPIDNAVLTLTEGAYSEVMQTFPTGDYVGAGERAGTYTLTAAAPGFTTQVIENIVVTEDPCHVHPVSLEVALDPL
jgi:hypothetical protein